MDYLHAILLALVQGLTEFLPVSSSAHLILLPRLLGWVDQGLAFDVAVHVGTLMAVIAYFRQDVACLLSAWGQSCVSWQLNADARLAWLVVFGTVPVAMVGLLFHDFIENTLRSPLVIAAATIGFGLLLGLSDLRGQKIRTEATLGITDVLWIGLAQALALIPGTSRSGITMTAALALGLTRSAAARFSFLLSVPVILMAGGYESLQLLQQAEPVDWGVIVLGTVVAGVSAYLSIHFFMRLIEKVGMLPFVVYRLLLGGFLLLLFV
ncbi:MAG: undecaprenyl-diphosphate phosphatase [Gammaproteobacteria bacterium]|nr:undecaprenyl-diphosphate phosphatase [Gammaproteobacteria bacterium]